MRYKTPKALEQAVKAAAVKSDRGTNRAIAGFYHDRFLCRIFSADEPAFVLKGGQSMLAKIPDAREFEEVAAAEAAVADWLQPVLEGEAEDFTMPTWKKQILDYLKEHNTVTPMDLAKAFNINPTTAKSHLQRAYKDGLIQKIGHGTYSKK